MLNMIMCMMFVFVKNVTKIKVHTVNQYFIDIIYNEFGIHTESFSTFIFLM